MSGCRQNTLDILLKERLVAVVRTPDDTGVIRAIEALSNAGIRCFEITMTISGAVELLRAVTTERPDLLIGAGTVLNEQQAGDCIEAGAKFIVSPVFSSDVVRRAQSLGTVVIPGALTPTEVMRAWTSGADLVKIFPAARLGPRYLKDLKAPLPEVKLVPTGGITADNIQDYLNAGADVVCAGSSLVDNKAIANNDMETLIRKGKSFLEAISGLQKKG